jgi:hypothetical protein
MAAVAVSATPHANRREIMGPNVLEVYDGGAARQGAPRMDVDTFVERFAPWRAKHMRTAYVPRLAAGDARSRFGGEPDMLPGEAWPACTSCKKPMRFLLQLDLASLPKRPGGEGLLQLFYCSTDAGDCETWRAFSGAQLARLVDGRLERRRLPEGVEAANDQAIERWDAVADYPSAEDHRALGIGYEYDFKAKTVRIQCPEIGLDDAGLDIDKYGAEAISSASEGDKLFGWPHWVQGAEYPNCPECGARMEHVFQLDSDQGAGLMFGDCGVGHITQCPKHPNVLAFGWACG